MTIICDIDGTIADIGHRLHFIKDHSKPNWDSFNLASKDDRPILSTVLLLRALHNANWDIVLLTGRTEGIRALTKGWLLDNLIPYNTLLMRKIGDYRADTVIKEELYSRYLIGVKVVFVLEDRDKCVEMWRGLGLTCFQVAKGEY